MRFLGKCAVLGISIGVSASGTACADDVKVDRPPAAAVSNMLRGGMTTEEAKNMARGLFRRLDSNGDGVLDASDGDLANRMQRAGIRSSRVAEILQYDVDGDGTVDENEILEVLTYRSRIDPGRGPSGKTEAFERQVHAVMAADADGNGRITLDETVAAGGKKAVEGGQLSLAKEIASFLALAGNTGGSLSAADFEEMFLREFRGVDSDGNGTLSNAEVAEAQRLRQEQVRAAAAPVCTLPRPSDAARVVVLSSYHAQSLSTTALGSQNLTVGTLEVEVEEGEGPIWLALLSLEPTIWRFTGALDRIERAVVASGIDASERGNVNPSDVDAKKETSIAGVVGLDAAKVTFMSPCLRYFTEIPSIDAARTLGLVRLQTGHEPIASASYAVHSFVVPAAKARIQRPGDSKIVPFPSREEAQEAARKIAAGQDRSFESRAAWNHPGGIVTIDPATVVASRKPEPYEILPGFAGLAQLAEQGAIGRNKNNEFVIKKQIRMPTGLGSDRFLLLRGVPRPTGNLGGTCVISEETGQPLPGLDRGVCH